jgi:hypothetical protein
MSKEDEPSYIDYEAFLDPDFSATSFANTLVLSTNNPSDTPLDLSTPLSRVLFDVQEVDTHIDTLTTKSALPLLEHTRDHAESSGHILHEVEGQVASLTESYKTLEKEVIERYEVAEQVRLTAERLCETVKLGRAVARCLMLGRQLEVRMSELGGVGSAKREDHRAMVRSADTILSLRQLLAASKPGEEGEGLDKVNVVNTLKTELVNPGERSISSRAQQVIKEFSMSSLLPPLPIIDQNHDRDLRPNAHAQCTTGLSPDPIKVISRITRTRLGPTPNVRPHPPRDIRTMSKHRSATIPPRKHQAARAPSTRRPAYPDLFQLPTTPPSSPRYILATQLLLENPRVEYVAQSPGAHE